MGDALSQSEIDALLAQMSSGEFDPEVDTEKKERHVQVYDFARPSKFSKEHLRTLVFIFEHYARLLSTSLPGYLRRNVQIEVSHSEANPFVEFTNALSNPVILGIVNFAPLEGNIIIELADSLGFTILDRMLGGVGTPLDKARDFTEIEMTIIERIMEVCTHHLVEPWKSVVDLTPKLERVETNSQFAQFISPNEMTATITMSMKIGSVEGLMNICIPFACVESVIEKINTKYWYATMKDGDEEGAYKESIEANIGKAAIPVTLQVGDIIKLDTKTEDELDIFVGNIKKFTGLPGSSSDSYAVRLTTVIREE